MKSERRRYLAFKRVVDVSIAALALLAGSPVIAATALAVRVKLGRPILFKQERIGLDGNLFQLYKFRTMLPIDPAKNQVTNADRVTTFGQALRATSLDELPSLINVLTGDMSIVGPRPLRTSYAPRYSRTHFRRHDVRPGITGLAQVVGRNSLGWNKRLDIDIWYVEHLSLRLDLSILVRTFTTVLRRDGVREDGQATASEFMGSGPLLVRRELRASDLPALQAWRGSTAGSEYDCGLDAARLNDCDGDTHVCTDADGIIVALFRVRPLQEDTGHIDLFVRPDLVGQGYGRLAMVHLLKVADERNLRGLYASLGATDRARRALYDRFGFAICDSGTDDDTAIMMARRN